MSVKKLRMVVWQILQGQAHFPFLFEQPIGGISLTDVLHRQFYTLNWPKSCQQRPTSASGLGHTQQSLMALTMEYRQLLVW